MKTLALIQALTYIELHGLYNSLFDTLTGIRFDEADTNNTEFFFQLTRNGETRWEYVNLENL